MLGADLVNFLEAVKIHQVVGVDKEDTDKDEQQY